MDTIRTVLHPDADAREAAGVAWERSATEPSLVRIESAAAALLGSMLRTDRIRVHLDAASVATDTAGRITATCTVTCDAPAWERTTLTVDIASHRDGTFAGPVPAMQVVAVSAESA